MFKLSPFDESIYIEADSQVVKGPNRAWILVKGKKFTVQGPEYFQGEWYGKTKNEIMGKMKINYFSKFNGEFFYFDKSDEAGRVFELSNHLFSNQYDKLGFSYIHGMKSDEPIIGIAMAMTSLKPLPDESNIMFTILGIDYLFKGIAKLSLSLPKCEVYFKKTGRESLP